MRLTFKTHKVVYWVESHLVYLQSPTQGIQNALDMILKANMLIGVERSSLRKAGPLDCSLEKRQLPDTILYIMNHPQCYVSENLVNKFVSDKDSVLKHTGTAPGPPSSISNPPGNALGALGLSG